MNDSVLFKWTLCLLMVSFCVGILCVTHSFSQEKPAISATKPAVTQQQPEVANEDQPEIFIETSEHDAGEVYEGTEVTHSFIVKNKGKGELRINKVKPGWGCSVASFDKAIPSGQEGKVSLKIKTVNFKGGKFLKSATIHSNDPKNPQLKIQLTGKVKKYFSIKPSSRVYLSGYEGEVKSEALKIINNEETPLKITHLESNIDDKINYELKPIVEGKEFELTIKTRTRLPVKTTGKITLTTNIEKKPKFEIRVDIFIRGELSVYPNVIDFGEISITTKPDEPPAKLEVTKYINVRKNWGDPVNIEKLLTSSDLIQTKIETREEGKLYWVGVSLNRKKLQKGKLEETLEIHTNHKKEPVFKISLKGNVI